MDDHDRQLTVLDRYEFIITFYYLISSNIYRLLAVDKYFK